jgi:hypothetical protein
MMKLPKNFQVLAFLKGSRPVKRVILAVNGLPALARIFEQVQ